MADNLDHSNLQGQAFTIILAFPCIATIALGLRLYSRSLTSTFAADDWFICGAWIVYWAETYTSYKLIQTLWIGHHVYDIPPPPIFDPVLGGKYSYATQILYNPILALIKTSIFDKWTVMIVVFLLTMLQCLPMAAMWDRASYPNAKCLNFADFVTGTAAASTVTDGFVLILPTWIVWDLQVHKKQKIILIGILSFGLVTLIAGIVRTVLLDRFDRSPPADSSYSLLFCLSTIEIGLAFVAACAPALRPIVVKVLPKVFGTRSTKYGKTSGQPACSNSYELSSRSRHNITQNHTQIKAGNSGPMSGLNKGRLQSKNGIIMTTETEIKWHDSIKASRRGSSTESLV